MIMATKQRMNNSLDNQNGGMNDFHSKNITFGETLDKLSQA